MERSREARRLKVTGSTNGLRRRRQRSSSLRDSPDGEKEMQEKVRLRDRTSKRDRNLLKRNKRRRRDKPLRRSNREGEESSEESSGEEDDYESEHSNRKISPPARVLRQDPALKAPDEIIAVSVPRKARSASVKRSHEYLMNGNGGFREDQNHRRPSTSPARQSADSELSSPSPSNVSVRKKMKPNALKTWFRKVSKPSSSVEEDIEIEIAEVLFGLKQTQGCKEENSIGNSLQKLESNDGNATSHGNEQLVTSPASDSLIGVAQEKKKVEAENSAPLVHVPLVAENSSSGISSPKSGKASHDKDKDAHKTASVSLESRENSMINQGDSRSSLEESNCVGSLETKEKSGSTKEECTKLDSDSTVTKATLTVSEVKSQREEKFKIDLMAPPPMQSSPEKDGLTDLEFDSKEKTQDTEKMEALVKYGNKAVKKEVGLEKAEKTITISEKRETLKLDLEKSNQLEQHDQKQQLPKASIPKMEKTVQSSSVPMPIALAGWPNGLPPPSYSLPFPTVAPNGSAGASPSTVLQSHFLPPQPRPKRCATHHYIARNIHLHQQLAKTNPFWPATSGSASVCNILPSTENFIMGNPLRGSFPVLNLNATEEKSQVVANFAGLTRKDKSSESTNVMDTAQRKQILIQQASQPASSGNLMHGPAYIFPLSQHQTMTTANPSGSSKRATSTNKASLSTGISAGYALPGVAAAVSVNYPNLGSKEAPYLTMLQNNGYTFAMSTLGNPSVTRGEAPAQAFPFLSGPFYSSQLFHSQLQQQQPHSQPLVQSTYQNASASSGSSSSLKQQEKNQRRGAQSSGEKFLIPRSMNPQQLQNYQMLPSIQSRKLEAEMSGENTAFVAGSRTSHMQKSVYGQNSNPPPQPPNFELVPSTKVGGNGGSGSGSGNLNEKQEQSQHKSLKGGVEIIPYQALAMSFASFPGNSMTSKFNFSSVAQNPAVFHSFPDRAKQQYQVAPVPNATEQKNNQISDVNNGTGSTILDGKKAVLGKPQAMNGQTAFFHNSARTLNFVPSPIIGNWPPHTISSTAATLNPHVIINSSNSHQQHQQQPVAAAHSKAQTANSMPASSIAAKLSNNDAIFPQALAQCNSSTQPTQACLILPTSHSATKFATHKNLRQQSQHGQIQISFGGNPKSAISPEVTTSGHVASPLTVSSPPSGGSLRTSSTGSKGGSSIPTPQSQQSENSSNGTGQKSSPVCGRNVPSILSKCPSHLSELRY
ncbi:hypothetical protein SLE2022_207240 [Rubroshorea leprosula]